MSNRQLLTLLTVGLPHTMHASDTIDPLVTDSGRDAIAALRMLRFDLLLAGHGITDMSVWSLMERVRTGWPRQHWALVSEHLDADEVRARSLGALCVFAEAPSLEELETFADALQTRPVAAVRHDNAKSISASKAS